MKIDHTCIHVADFGKCLRFYRGIIGLKLIRKITGKSIRPGKGRITIAFLGDDDGTQLELLYDHEGDKKYSIGTKIDHINLLIEDFDQKVNKWKKDGIKFILDPIKPDYRDDVGRIAFIEDPEGVKIEVTEAR